MIDLYLQKSSVIDVVILEVIFCRGLEFANWKHLLCWLTTTLTPLCDSALLLLYFLLGSYLTQRTEGAPCCCLLLLLTQTKVGDSTAPSSLCLHDDLALPCPPPQPLSLRPPPSRHTSDSVQRPLGTPCRRLDRSY